MNFARQPFVVFAALMAGVACGPSGATDAGADADLDATADGAADVVTDVAADRPTDSGSAPLSYTPTGCAHVVRTTRGTRGNVMGDTMTFGAAAAPRAVHVNWPTSDPSTTAAFLWLTDEGTLATVARYGTDRARLDRMSTGHRTSGGLGDTFYSHEVHVCGLQPGTTYYYQVGGEGHWSEIYSFVTAPAPAADVEANFAVSGDSRDDANVWRMVQDQILATSGMRQPDFELFTGDAVLAGIVQPQWDAWFAGAASTMHRMPFVLDHGNHEALAVNYLAQIAQPQTAAGDVAQDELYFSVDYGPVHLVVLNDSTGPGGVTGAQLAWLRNDLMQVNRARTPWIVATHHKGAFSSSRHRDDADVREIRATWPPVFDMFDVDLVLNGHDHNFEVTQPLRGDGTVAPSGTHGTVYATVAGAGADLYGNGTSAFTLHSERVVNFALVRATMRMLTLTPHRGDGTVITQGVVTLAR